MRRYVKIFLLLGNKKYIYIIKIYSVAIEINIKGCIKWERRKNMVAFS